MSLTMVSGQMFASETLTSSHFAKIGGIPASKLFAAAVVDGGDFEGGYGIDGGNFETGLSISTSNSPLNGGSFN